METFEDENPFETDDRISSETSSASKVDISEPNSPSPNIARPLSQSPTSFSANKTFSTQGSSKQPTTFKSDYCCTRDRWLHSEQDVEITVSASSMKLVPLLPDPES
jgi:sorting nexin-4